LAAPLGMPSMSSSQVEHTPVDRASIFDLEEAVGASARPPADDEQPSAPIVIDADASLQPSPPAVPQAATEIATVTGEDQHLPDDHWRLEMLEICIATLTSSHANLLGELQRYLRALDGGLATQVEAADSLFRLRGAVAVLLGEQPSPPLTLETALGEPIVVTDENSDVEP
jgi:hypothetical protein